MSPSAPRIYGMRRAWTADRIAGREMRAAGLHESTPLGATDRLLRHAERTARGCERSPRPALHLAILTCMDSRIDPAGLFGLAPGDAQILRNAGGAATDDVIKSVRLTQENFGVRDVVVVQHRGCVALDDPADPRRSVARALAAISRAPGLTVNARGFVLDIPSGTLTEVHPRLTTT